QNKPGDAGETRSRPMLGCKHNRGHECRRTTYPDQGLSQKKPVDVGSQGTDCSPQNCEPRNGNHRVADAEYVECQPHWNLHQREAPMKDAAKQRQCGRAGIYFFSDAVDGNGGDGPECLSSFTHTGEHPQLSD